MNLEDRVKGLISEQLNWDGTQIELSINSKLKEIGLSSLDFVMLVVKIEEAFDIEYPEDELIMTDKTDIKHILKVIRHCMNASDDFVT